MAVWKYDTFFIDRSALEVVLHVVTLSEVKEEAWVEALDAIYIVITIWLVFAPFVESWLSNIDIALVILTLVAQVAIVSGRAETDIALDILHLTSNSFLIIWKISKVFKSRVSHSVLSIWACVLVTVVLDLTHLTEFCSIFAGLISASLDWILFDDCE